MDGPLVDRFKVAMSMVYRRREGVSLGFDVMNDVWCASVEALLVVVVVAVFDWGKQDYCY